MGSSAAFAVGLINALTSLRGEKLSKYELAAKAIELEQTVLNENVGCQDQIACAYGGFNTIRFLKDGSFCVEPLRAPKQRLLELESRLMLFYTGVSRSASEVAAKVIAHLGAKKKELGRMKEIVGEAVDLLGSGQNMDGFGRLLKETWELKKRIAPGVTNARIDGILDAGIENGAIGGKLLGAGGTGFVLFYVPTQYQDRVRKALHNYLYVPFRFDVTGSKIGRASCRERV